MALVVVERVVNGIPFTFQVEEEEAERFNLQPVSVEAVEPEGEPAGDSDKGAEGETVEAVEPEKRPRKK